MKPIFLTLFGILLTMAIIPACKKSNNDNKNTASLKVALVSPDDGSTLSSTSAQFSWSASSSNSTVPMTYKISVVQITGDQTAENALRTNKPFFEKDTIQPSFIQYPLTTKSPGFVAGGKYAWKVTAKQEGLAITGGESGIRTFNVPNSIAVTLGSPADGSTISSSSGAQFSWSSVTSNTSVPVNYKISIFQITGDQPAESDLHNKPFFEKDTIKSLNIQYPISAKSPGFVVGSKYVWQVTAWQDNLVTTGGASALSVFTVAK